MKIEDQNYRDMTLNALARWYSKQADCAHGNWEQVNLISMANGAR